jgi:hypothetical protein
MKARIVVEYEGKEYGVVLPVEEGLFIEEVKKTIVEELKFCDPVIFGTLVFGYNNLILFADEERSVEITDKKMPSGEEFYAKLVIPEQKLVFVDVKAVSKRKFSDYFPDELNQVQKRMKFEDFGGMLWGELDRVATPVDLNKIMDSHNTSKIKDNMENEDECIVECEFEFMCMREFPVLIHPSKHLPHVLVRKCYVSILNSILDYVKKNIYAHVIVTGNPGVGKSRMYLYFGYMLAKKCDLFGKKLVMNCKSSYLLYDRETDTFVEVSDVNRLMQDSNIIRLIDGESSSTESFMGVSILFASPGAPRLHSFEKVRHRKFYVPPWTLSELEVLNEILPIGENLDTDVLFNRYSLYGGIPRFIFDLEPEVIHSKLHESICSGNLCDLINFVKKKQPVQEKHYSHLLLHMIPSNGFRKYHLDFASGEICEKIIKLLDSESLEKFTEFTILETTSFTSSLRGHLYEQFFHCNFTSLKFLKGKSLLRKEKKKEEIKQESFELEIHPDTVIERFVSLDDVVTLLKNYEKNAVYIRPISKRFPAIDSMFWDTKKLYLFQVTISTSHGIHHKTIEDILKVLSVPCVYCFVTPPRVYEDYVYYQRYLNLDNKSMRTKPPSSTVAKLEQFALKHDLIEAKIKGRQLQGYHELI